MPADEQSEVPQPDYLRFDWNEHSEPLTFAGVVWRSVVVAAVAVVALSLLSMVIVVFPLTLAVGLSVGLAVRRSGRIASSAGVAAVVSAAGSFVATCVMWYILMSGFLAARGAQWYMNEVGLSRIVGDVLDRGDWLGFCIGSGILAFLLVVPWRGTRTPRDEKAREG